MVCGKPEACGLPGSLTVHAPSILDIVISNTQVNLCPSRVTKEGVCRGKEMDVRKNDGDPESDRQGAGRRGSNLSSRVPTRSQFRNTWKRKCDEIS